jgi:hypothetical protein
MSVPHTLMEASEVNGWQHLTQQFRGASGDITGIPTTMSSGASKSIIPAKDSIITYGHKKDSTGRLIEAAVGIKGKESGILSLTKPKTGLLEGANEASAAYKRVQANMVSPTSVASGGLHAPAVQPKVPAELRPYIREVEAKSGLAVHPEQRELLATDLRKNTYTKLEPADYKAHQNQFTESTKDRLITEWEHNTGQTWPKHPEDMKTKKGLPHRQAGGNYHAHHINPQELGGKHEWWNMHPVHIQDHIGTGGVHSGVLNVIVKDASK